MNYFQELDAWLTAVLLATDEDADEDQWFSRVKKQLKEKILESYRNGQKAGMAPKSSPRAPEESPRAPRTGRPWPPRGRERR